MIFPAAWGYSASTQLCRQKYGDFFAVFWWRVHQISTDHLNTYEEACDSTHWSPWKTYYLCLMWIKSFISGRVLVKSPSRAERWPCAESWPSSTAPRGLWMQALTCREVTSPQLCLGQEFLPIIFIIISWQQHLPRKCFCDICAICQSGEDLNRLWL